MHERTIEQDSLDEFEQKTLAAIAALLHLNAVSHGFWDCPTCHAEPTFKFFDEYGVGQASTCPTCDGKRTWRNFGESIALIISEYSEALEAARNPDDDAKCDKCDGNGAFYGGFINRGAETSDTQVEAGCTKCGETGENICGSRVLEELVDGLIRGLETASKVADDLGLDLGKAFAAKHRYNLTRPHKHGKKF